MPTQADSTFGNHKHYLVDASDVSKQRISGSTYMCLFKAERQPYSQKHIREVPWEFDDGIVMI